MTKIRSLAAVYKALEVHVCNTQYNVTNVQSPRIIVIALSFVTGQARVMVQSHANIERNRKGNGFKLILMR